MFLESSNYLFIVLIPLSVHCHGIAISYEKFLYISDTDEGIVALVKINVEGIFVIPRSYTVFIV